MKLEHSYGDFLQVVRGFDPRHAGIEAAQFTTSIDGGAGFGGALIAACFDRRGEIVEAIEA